MKLLTKEILKKLSALYATDDVEKTKVKVPLKLFTPWTNWTWYLWEYDPETRTGFGLTVGLEKELGYVDLAELEAVVGPVGLKVERDRHYLPETVAELFEREGYGYEPPELTEEEAAFAAA